MSTSDAPYTCSISLSYSFGLEQVDDTRRNQVGTDDYGKNSAHLDETMRA